MLKIKFTLRGEFFIDIFSTPNISLLKNFKKVAFLVDFWIK